MDQEYVQGLRDAKALLDEGIFTQEEFMREKETLSKQREERAAERARLGVSVMPVIINTQIRDIGRRLSTDTMMLPSPSTATPQGADAPAPSTNPALPDPASLLTVPSGVIMSTRLKLIVCMTLVIVVLVVVVIVMQFSGINPLKNMADCSLTSLKNAKQCLNATEMLLDNLGLSTGGGFRPAPKPTPAPKADYSHCCVFINPNLMTTTTPAATTTPIPTTTPGPNQKTPAPANSQPTLGKLPCGILDPNYVRIGEDVSIGLEEWKRNCIATQYCGGTDQFECHAPPPEPTTTPPPTTQPSDASRTPGPNTTSTLRRFLLWDQGSAATGQSRGGQRIDVTVWVKGGLAGLGAEGRSASADSTRLAVAKGAEAEAFAGSAAGRQSALREASVERGAGGGILFGTVDEGGRPRA